MPTSGVKRCCADLAVYFLAATADTMTELIARRRDECMKQLMQIADGTINPGGNVPGATGSNKLEANTRQLTRDKLCWII